MAAFDAKEWLRASLKQFWPLIKSYIGSQVDAAKEQLRTEIGAVTGSFKGSFDKFADMGAITAKNGEWAVLKVDDGTNESGIYVKAATGWQFVADITSIDELQGILATDDEFNKGTSTSKTATIKQIADALSARAEKGGKSTQSFLVADAEADTKQAVNASQFKSITADEAKSDWTNA